jgi:hypothetical protein
MGVCPHLTSKDGYEDTILPSGAFAATPEKPSDCACDLYFSDPNLSASADGLRTSAGQY